MPDDELAQKRREVAEARARIDDHLDEVVAHVPQRDEVLGAASRWGAVAAAGLVAVGTLVVVSRRRLDRRRDRRTGREYAEALVAALPEVAAAYRAAVVDGTTTAVVAADQPLDDPADLDDLLDEVRPADDVRRPGVGTALLTGLGVLAGVAAGQRLGRS